MSTHTIQSNPPAVFAGIALSCCLLAGTIFAAQPVPVDPRREIAGNQPQELKPGLFQNNAPQKLRSEESVKVLGTGSEFGEQVILRRRAHVEPWSVSVDGFYTFTDNVALTNGGEESDWYLRTGANIAYTNRIKGPVFLDIALQHYLTRYANYDVLDFDDTRISLGLLYQAAWLDDAFLFARYAYERLSEPGLGSKLFDQHSLILGAQKVWKISRGQQVYAGYSSDIALAAAPDSAGRDEHALALGYNIRLTTALTAQLSYRLAHYRYDEGGRKDWNQIVALGLIYDATDWLRLSATASWTSNQSNKDFAEYQNAVAGLGLSLRLSF